MKGLPVSPFPSNLMLSRRKRKKNRTVIHHSFPFISVSYYLVTISTHFKDYALAFLNFQILEGQALVLYFVHTMLTDVGEQYNHDLIHMIISYMTQILFGTAQNPVTQHDYAMIIQLQVHHYFKTRKQDL